jgi:hypothetical protein
VERLRKEEDKMTVARKINPRTNRLIAEAYQNDGIAKLSESNLRRRKKISEEINFLRYGNLTRDATNGDYVLTLNSSGMERGRELSTMRK